MKIKLAASEFEFHFLDPNIRWKTQNPSSKFAFVPEAMPKMFVKRTEPPSQFAGADLLTALSNKTTKPIRNAPQVLAMGYSVQDGRHFYVTEMLQGMTLAARLNDRSRPELTLSARLKLVLSIYEALLDINDNGYWFFDFSPLNIFVARDDERSWLIDIDSCLSLKQLYSNDGRTKVSREYLPWTSGIYPIQKRQLHTLNAIEWAMFAADALKGQGFRIRRVNSKDSNIQWRIVDEWYQEIGAAQEFNRLRHAVINAHSKVLIWQMAEALRDKIKWSMRSRILLDRVGWPALKNTLTHPIAAIRSCL